MSRFFATPEDLLPVFSSVEARRQVVYTLMGHVSEPDVRSFSAASELPTLFGPAPADSVSAGHAYLVTDATNNVSTRELSPYRGAPRWAIDQLNNPDSAVLQHGGFFGKGVLLHGSIRTASKSAVAIGLQRAFDVAIRKHFVRVQAFYVGKQAESLLDSGYRLTFSAGAPGEYDLHRQPVPRSDA
jgi:hypothetical protein